MPHGFQGCANASRRISLLLSAGSLAFGLAALPESSARAQASRLQTDLIVQSTSGTQDLQEHDTGFIHSTAPLGLSFTTNAGSGGASVTATASASAFYGLLDVSGSGSVSSPLSSGGDASVTAFMGSGPVAQFEDEVVVNSSTLAKGTLVSLTFTELFSSQATFSNDPAGDPSSSFIQSKFVMDDLRDDSMGFTFLDGVGAFANTKTVLVEVGDTLDVLGQLFAHGEAASNHGGSSSFSFNDPMSIDIDAITPGVTLLSDSGHDYSTPAPAGGAPEPAAWALMCVGFLGLGGALRRQRRGAAAV
jgi:hypothetical protein